jgi:hypothetical protein
MRRSLLALAEATEGHLRHLAPCPVPASREPEPGLLLSRDGEAAAGLPSDAIASHAEPAEVKADPREGVESARALSQKRSREPASGGAEV